MEIHLELRKIGYRVVPDFIYHSQRFELIIEPWDYRANRRVSSKRVKRTGIFFLKNECTQSSIKETFYMKKLQEVQLKLINHFKSKS